MPTPLDPCCKAWDMSPALVRVLSGDWLLRLFFRFGIGFRFFSLSISTFFFFSQSELCWLESPLGPRLHSMSRSVKGGSPPRVAPPPPLLRGNMGLGSIGTPTPRFLLYLRSCEELADVCKGGGKCIGDDAAPSFGIITEDAGAVL